MLDGNTQIICWDSSLFNLSDSALDTSPFKILGRDHHGQFFPTKLIQRLSTPAETNWHQIIATSVTIICTPSAYLWTTAGWKLASNITTSDHIFALSGTNTFSFVAGGSSTHVSIANQYNALFASFPVTTSSVYSQTATSYGLKCSVGQYLANRFLVRGE